ncbi:MAG: hypothetical protein AAGJ83_05535 [Planctomycetota bacterium]
MSFAEQSGDEIIADSFLPVRAKILELAATFDRIDRAAKEAPISDASLKDLQKLRQAVELLLRDDPTRAELLQKLFSRPYHEDWRSKFGLDRSAESPELDSSETVGR